MTRGMTRVVTNDTFLTIEESSLWLRIPSEELRILIRMGKLKTFKRGVGRDGFLRSQLIAFADERAGVEKDRA